MESEEPTPLPEQDPQVRMPMSYEDVDPYTADHRDYVLLQSRVNLMASSQMADLKANLILTLSAIMLQFGLTQMTSPEPIAHRTALLAIVIGSVITIVLCGYSTIPISSFRRKMFGEQEELPGSFTLLFFGSYTKLPKQRFKEMMHATLSSPPRTHDSILDELYTHGQFIMRKKFLPLRLAYTTFLLTWLLSALLFLVG